MNSKPIISVVMPAYNAEKYIAEAIESVIAQTFTDWELVIVDDCSSDATLGIARKYEEQDSRIRVFHLEKNTGSAYLPRKKAIEQSQSEWIVCLDADDFIENDDLKELYNRQKDTEADIVLHQMVRVSEDGKNILKEKCPSSNFDFDALLSGKEACGLTIGKWSISGGGLFPRILYKHIFLQNQFKNEGMNGDELLTRLLFLSADKIALCTARYFYRSNSLSITQKFSTKLFDVLETNADLMSLVIQHFGANSLVTQKMALQQCYGLISCSLSLYSRYSSFPADIKNDLEQRLRKGWCGIDWGLVRPQLRYRPFSDFLSLNYGLYKLLIRCWIYVKCIKQKL